MEVSQVLGERARWDMYLPVFANLLRPSTSPDPVVEISLPDGDAINESITQFRNGTDGETLKSWGDQIINLIFDGYSEWAGYYASQPEWVLTNLAQYLEDAGQQITLLQHLQQIADAPSETRDEALNWFKNDIDRWLPQWQYNANTQLAGAQGPLEEGRERVQAYPNTDNWNYSRTPGTFYYRYLERDGRYVYVYNDREDAPDEDWRELYHWDSEAERLALGNGELCANGWPEEWSGWYVVPVPSEYQALYEGAWVYGKGTDGPWMTEARAERQTAEAARLAGTETPAGVGADPAASLAELAQDVAAVIARFTDAFMAKLPPETAGNPAARSLVEQGARRRASKIFAARAAHEEG